MNEDTEKLKEIKQQVIGQISSLMVDAEIDPEQKFALIISQLAGSPSLDLFRKAFDTAQLIEDATAKVDALVRLVGEIDFQLQGDEQTGSEPSV